MTQYLIPLVLGAFGTLGGAAKSLHSLYENPDYLNAVNRHLANPQHVIDPEIVQIILNTTDKGPVVAGAAVGGAIGLYLVSRYYAEGRRLQQERLLRNSAATHR